MTKYIALALLFALSACSSPNEGKEDKNDAVPPANVEAPGQRAPAEKRVDARLSLQLDLAKAGDQSVYFVDVQPTLAKCLPCHAAGANKPSLDSFPLADASLNAVASRINNAAHPMPPSGLLPAAERQALASWIDAGAPSVAQPSQSKDLEAYALDVTWSTQGGNQTTHHIAGNSSGTFELGLGSLPLSAMLNVQAKVTGPGGKVVFDKTFPLQSLSSSGVVSLPLRAVAVKAATIDHGTTSPVTPVNPDTPTTEEPTTPVVVTPPPPPPVVETELVAQLNLVQPGDTSVPITTFIDVQPLFGKCMPCHARGDKSPDLSSFPFTGKDGETLASVMQKIAERTNDATKPMPQTGLLPVGERTAIGAWISAGYLSLPPASTPSPELGSYSVELSWTSDAGTTGSETLSRSNLGNYALAAGLLPVGTKITATVRVTGPRNTVVFDKTFAPVAVPMTGKISLPLRAVAVDVTAPAAGQQGDIRGSNLTHASLSLRWTEGRDLVTAAGNLRYTVYQSSSNDLTDVQAIKANGTKVSPTIAGLTSLDVASLTPSSTYYFNVIVEDQAGNEAAYHTYSATTEDDPNAPVVSEYPNCITGTQTRQKVEAWRNSAAKALEGSESEAAVAQHIKQCFPAQVPQCVKPVLGYTQRNDIASSSADGSIAQSPERLPPKEFLAPGGNGLQWVIPPNVEEIARANGWPVVRYKSRHAGGFDPETPNLLMVYVPGSTLSPAVNYDQWLNFATPKDGNADGLTPAPQAPLAQDEDFDQGHNFGAGMPRVFTMVSLDRPQNGKPGQVYFQMFDRESQGPKFNPRSNSGVTSCVSCHPNGLRAISPLGLHVRASEAQLPVEDWFAAKVINDSMDTAANKKAVSWRSGKVNGVMKPFFNAADQGPIMGLETPLNDKFTRSKAFIMGGTLPNGQTAAGCFKRRNTVSVRDIFGRAPGANNVYTLSANPSIRWDKVRDSMKCATCHNNVDRGGLNNTMDMSQVDFKILVDQSMPDGMHVNPLDTVDGVPGSADSPVKDQLTADERIALANCVAAEFEQEKQFLAKSLSQTRCE